LELRPVISHEVQPATSNAIELFASSFRASPLSLRSRKKIVNPHGSDAGKGWNNPPNFSIAL